jgi:hypothetical protein
LDSLNQLRHVSEQGAKGTAAVTYVGTHAGRERFRSFTVNKFATIWHLNRKRDHR